MEKFTLTSQERDILRNIHTHSTSHFLRKRAHTICLLAEGKVQREVASTVGIRQETVSRYLGRYLEGGWANLGRIRFKGRKDSFAEAREELSAALEKDPPATIREARDKIEAVTGRRLSATGTGKLLKRLNIKRRKVRQAPPQPTSPEKREKLDGERKDFSANVLTPSLHKAREGAAVTLALDAAHFVMSPVLGHVWSARPKHLQATPGRKRFSTLGALDVVTREVTRVETDGTVDAQLAQKLLRAVAEKYPDQPKIIILDNARYQKTKEFRELAEELGIKLEYLPAYTPHYNLIERVWKFVKKKALANKWHKEFSDFCSAVRKCLDDLAGVHAEEMKTLLTWNFQSFANVEFLK